MIKREYTSIFATKNTHARITTFNQLSRSRWNSSMGLFFNGVPVGYGTLCLKNKQRKYVNTSFTEIFKKWRKLGHGIELYKKLIETARELGAARIYSDTSLNKLSRRMWKVKLGRAGFNVVTAHPCKNGCRHCNKKEVYYIAL